MKRNSRGFNIFELMVAIAVLGILFGIGAPTYREFTRRNNVTAANNDLVTSLNLARSESLRRNRPVSLCASTNGEDCGSDEDWDSGWIAFTDRNTAGVIDGTDEILQVWQTLNSNLVFDSDGASFVQYQPTGMVANAVTVDIHWEGCTGDKNRRISVIATGAVYGEKISCP